MTYPALVLRRASFVAHFSLALLVCALTGVAAADEVRKNSKGKRGSQEHQVLEMRKELKDTKVQLERTRDSLHEAHKELGFKAEQISKLQQQVKAMGEQLETAIVEMRKLMDGSAKSEQLAKSLENERRTNQQLRKQLEEVKKQSAKAISEAKKATGKQKETAAKKPVASREAEKKGKVERKGKSIALDPVLFDKMSAVNYKDRDRVLEEFRTILKSDPGAVFFLTGHADDSRWSETNRDISVNRAQFLANHLRFHGIPAEKLKLKGEGSEKPSKVGTRRVDIVVKVP